MWRRECNWVIVLGVLVLWGLGGIARGADDANAAVEASKFDHVVKVACVGDSITEGVGTSHLIGRRELAGVFGEDAGAEMGDGEFWIERANAFKSWGLSVSDQGGDEGGS